MNMWAIILSGAVLLDAPPNVLLEKRWGQGASRSYSFGDTFLEPVQAEFVVFCLVVGGCLQTPVNDSMPLSHSSGDEGHYPPQSGEHGGVPFPV